MICFEIKRLRRNFDGVKAVQDVSCQFEKGKISGLIGPNGSGKSTLIHLLSGFYPWDAGEIVFENGDRVRSLKPSHASRHGITRTFQDVHIFEQMKVLDNMLVVLTNRRVFASLFSRNRNVDRVRAEAVLRRVGLWEKRDQLASQLSYGQRKLLEVARVLAMDAEIFLFDEPFAGLFPEMVKTMIDVMKELREQGKTILLVEHNMQLIRELCDHVVVMDAGQILAEGKPEDVLARRDVIEAYLGT